MFAPKGDGIRVRLGSDVWRIVLSFALLAIVVFAYRHNARIQQWLVHLTIPAPVGITWLLTALALAGTFGVVILLFVTSLISRRNEVIIDVVGAAAISLLFVAAFRYLLGVTAGTDLARVYPKVNVGIPVPAVTVAVAVALAARPYLARSFQRLCYIGFGLGAVSTVFDGRGLPSSVIASLLIGWGSAAAMRLITGTPSGLPGVDEVIAMLRELGLDVRELDPRAHQRWGAARFDGTEASGRRLRVSVFGRDARDAELASSIGRAIAYRNAGRSLLVSRLQQAEHLAYLTLRATEALGGRTATLVSAGAAGPSRDGIVVSAPPDGAPLRALLEGSTPISDATARSLLTGVIAIGAQGVSHGSIDQDHIIVAADGTVAIDDFLNGASGATPALSSRDLASAIACCALSLGVEHTLAIALDVAGPERLTSCLPYFQKAALPSALSDALKEKKELLDTLRTDGAKQVGVEAPEPAKMTRVSGTTLVIAIGTVIGGWALIAVFLNVAASFSTIKGANLLWVLVVALLAVIPYPAGALADEGSIPGALPFFKLTILELSNAFSGLAVGTVAVLAARVRFYQKEGYDATTAVSSGVLTSASSWIIKGGLFLIALPFALSSFDFKDNPSGGSHAKLIWLVLAVVCLVGIALAVVLFVPRWRSVIKKKLAPKTTEIRDHLIELAARPSKLFELFGGALIAQLAVAYALGASLHAFGTSLSIAQILIVLTLGSMLGGISPVPGGMGVVEAGMIIGLTAVGVPENIAVSAVFVQRLFTAYLPPLFGWFALIWLRRRDLL
jgi:uncharacterized membrane protein YbhN (UPF0104 family)